MLRLLVVVLLALAGCADSDSSVTYEIEIGLLPAASSVVIDGTAVESREVLVRLFDSLADLRAWSTVASVQTSDSMFQVEMKASDSYTQCEEPGHVTLIHEVWELNDGQLGNSLMFWAGIGRVEIDNKPACVWTY